MCLLLSAWLGSRNLWEQLRAFGGNRAGPIVPRANPEFNMEVGINIYSSANNLQRNVHSDATAKDVTNHAQVDPFACSNVQRNHGKRSTAQSGLGRARENMPTGVPEKTWRSVIVSQLSVQRYGSTPVDMVKPRLEHANEGAPQTGELE